jgi:hypothetical protein
MALLLRTSIPTFAERLSIEHFVHGFLDRVGGVLDGLLSLPDCLVSLSFLAKLVVPRRLP